MGEQQTKAMFTLGAKLLIVDSRRLSRDALQRLLSSSARNFVGEGRTLAEALRTMQPEARPDLIICNFESDREAERELPAIREARARFEGVRLVLLTDGVQLEVLKQAVHAGVEAILSKDISIDVLRRVLELVLLGQHLFPTRLVQELLAPAGMEPEQEGTPVLSAAAPYRAPHRQRDTALSRREDQILKCLVAGLSNKVIARELNITEATVKVHIKGLLRKTHMTNRTQAAIWALSHNFGGNTSGGRAEAVRPALRDGREGPLFPAGQREAEKLSTL
jgi:two-component system nitrate/nitrite response regulator NarL